MPSPRGVTLIENMVALAVLMLGALGLIGMSTQAVRLNQDGRRVTRATAIAQDMLSQIQLWEYADARLSNSNTTNDADIADSALAFEGTNTLPYDHAEADLTDGGLVFNGIPQSQLGTEFERYWNISTPDDDNANGTPDGMRIAVVVRWRQGNGFRRIVLHTAKINPDPAERL
ncbi:MAG: prepilin-type N-terminal cleavage/methylation domain-containing protein [Anaeromyxobacter sp.]